MARLSAEVKALLEVIERSRVMEPPNKSAGYRPRAAGFNVDKIAEHIIRLSSRKRKALVSDKYWIRYPMYVSWRNKNHPKPYGHLLSSVVSNLCSYSKVARGSLVRYSEGVLQAYTVESTKGSDRLKVCDRGIFSKDSRVRGRAAKYISVKKAKSILRDVDYSVKYTLIERIGPDNCSDLLLDDECQWIRSEALSCSGSSKEESASTLMDKVETIDKMESGDYYKDLELVALLKRVSDDDLLYFLNLSCSATNSGWSAGEYVKKRLEYMSYEAQ